MYQGIRMAGHRRGDVGDGSVKSGKVQTEQMFSASPPEAVKTWITYTGAIASTGVGLAGARVRRAEVRGDRSQF